MSYFDEVKTGDKVWSVVNGWGKVVEIEKDTNMTLAVEFPSRRNNIYIFNFEGKHYEEENQTLFWDEIKFEVPKKPKIKLKNDYSNFINMNVKLNYEVIAFCTIKKFAKLLALRDQECGESRGYEFQNGSDNWYIYPLKNGNYSYLKDININSFTVYFKTKKDAQKICDILNEDRFSLKGEDK